MLTCNLFLKETSYCLSSLPPALPCDWYGLYWILKHWDNWSLPIKRALDVSFHTFHPWVPHAHTYPPHEVTDISQHNMVTFEAKCKPSLINEFDLSVILSSSLSPSVSLSRLNFTLILCCCWLDLCSRPLTLDSETSDQSPLWGGTKLIEALLVNCIRGQLKDSSPQSLPLLYFDPPTPPPPLVSQRAGPAVLFL